ncbi:MAG: hypothetical protein J6B15_03210 [Muribaculaceae bacterium]|nr:hypothetical protein [Muribaculaceae bacterium]
MKKVLIMALAAMSLTAQAQIVDVTSTQQLLKGVDSNMYYPVLSTDGSKMLYTSENFQGLKLYDFKDNVTQKVSDESRAGLDATFSCDGQTVYFVTQTWQDNRNMRQAKSYDIATRKLNEISAKGRVVARPMALKNGVMTTIDGVVSITDNKSTTVRTKGSVLYIGRNGVEKAYTPVESHAGYLWESLSPDGTKVMFFAAGKGIVITDLNGNVLKQLGNYESPVWFGNDCVVAMNAKHNGYQHTASQIVLMRADGSELQELTRPESMTMNPTASFEAGKIVYNTIDGRLYQMNVNLK